MPHAETRAWRTKSANGSSGKRTGDAEVARDRAVPGARPIPAVVAARRLRHLHPENKRRGSRGVGRTKEPPPQHERPEQSVWELINAGERTGGAAGGARERGGGKTADTHRANTTASAAIVRAAHIVNDAAFAAQARTASASCGENEAPANPGSGEKLPGVELASWLRARLQPASLESAQNHLQGSVSRPGRPARTRERARTQRRPLEESSTASPNLSRSPARWQRRGTLWC